MKNIAVIVKEALLTEVRRDKQKVFYHFQHFQSLVNFYVQKPATKPILNQH